MVAVNGFNLREENNIHKSILFGIPVSNGGAIVINIASYILSNTFIWKKIKDKNKKINFNVDFWGSCPTSKTH